jgi:membrane protease YdiL (CAAX protease family)
MAGTARNQSDVDREVNAKDSWLELARYFGLIACCAFSSTLAGQLLLGRGSSDVIRWLCKCLLVMASVCGVTTYFLRRAGERWDNYGVEWSAKVVAKVAWGIVGGLLVAWGWAEVVRLQTPFRLEINPSPNVLRVIFGVIAAFAIGIGEEVGYRSYGMEQARRASGLVGALLIPTSIFVLAHVIGGVPWQAGLLVVGTCSLLYGVLMIATRSLPLVAAFHIANNLFQDAVLRTSADSLWQAHFQNLNQAQRSALHIWWSIALVNVATIGAVTVWRKKQAQRIRRAHPPSRHEDVL